MITFQERYNSEESLEDNQSTTSSTESRQSDFAKKEHEFIPTRRYAKLYCMVLYGMVWYGMVGGLWSFVSCGSRPASEGKFEDSNMETNKGRWPGVKDSSSQEAGVGWQVSGVRSHEFLVDK